MNSKKYNYSGELKPIPDEKKYSAQEAQEFWKNPVTSEKKEVEKKFPQIDLNGLKSFYFEHEAGYLPARHCCQVVLENFVKRGGEYVF